MFNSNTASGSYAEIIGHKKLSSVFERGGVDGILRELDVLGQVETRQQLGIATNTIRQRQVRYGSNALPPPPRETIWHFFGRIHQG
ncbi:hypothetical protein AGDE_14681 [Angomonas deanei]|uniref:Cation transporter/ATPase, N-terminus, putative n=1 Tax=Angomonas deanei TaxID=59799 RepID=A0A7G2CGD4_9TRYP|nr:hypothetical protein AGDE_14681 [Angomonas deanei]CAD2217753.1 Cation transporter/ATPase, N-terminus, putative [Angomonas deanei]|eukprot:EPY20425.1 hypothetical protein AGDE_14681 [Angomonas deanei]